jgi:HD-like signal output (HDOD) protein
MDARTLVTNVTSMFSLPDVVLRVNDLINFGEATNAELEEIILNDPALTAKILKFGNSPYFGFSGKISTVSNAISLIGHKELRNLVIASAVTSTFKGIPPELVDMDRFWYHSVTCGVVARLLASNIKSRERFFIAGLLHGVGKLILFNQFPEQSAKILTLVEKGEEAILEAENKAFGFIYPELGAELLKQWRLPESIWKMVRYQSDPMQEESVKMDACILYAAFNIANYIQPYTHQHVELEEMQLIEKLESWGYLGLTPEVIESTITVAKLHVIEVLNAIR